MLLRKSFSFSEEQGLIVSPPAWLGARLRHVVRNSRLRHVGWTPGGYVWQGALEDGSSIG